MTNMNSSDVLEGLCRRIEVEIHRDQTGFKCIGLFVELESLLSRIPQFPRNKDATIEEESLRLADFINSCDLLEQIGQGMLREFASDTGSPNHELAVSIIARLKQLIDAGSELRPAIYYYVVGGFEYGLAYFIAIDDRFWDDNELAVPDDAKNTAAVEPESQVAACNDVVRHAVERNQQHPGLYVISGFMPHWTLQDNFPAFENSHGHTGRELSKSLAVHLQESGDVLNVVAELLKSIAGDSKHDDQEMAQRILQQIREDMSKNQDDFRKPVHYMGGNEEGLAIAVAIDDRFWTDEW